MRLDFIILQSGEASIAASETSWIPGFGASLTLGVYECGGKRTSVFTLRSMSTCSALRVL